MDEERTREQDKLLREAIIAELHPDEPADNREWYLPAPGLDQARYKSFGAARTASMRLSAIRGIPFVDPITTDEPFRD